MVYYSLNQFSWLLICSIKLSYLLYLHNFLLTYLVVLAVALASKILLSLALEMLTSINRFRLSLV